MKKLLLLLLIVSVAAQAQNKFTFVFLHKKTDQKELAKEEVDKIMKGHMANMERLAKEGQLLAAGPFDGGGGIFIFKSTSQDEVKGLLATDPGVKAERWNVEILSYQPRIGGICPVGEKYEMTSYQFVHFKPNVMKFNVQNADETIRKHIAFVKELNNGGIVITEATFGGLDGGILVMKGDLQPEVISADPAVAEGLFEPDFKKLWIAKGSFCEK